MPFLSVSLPSLLIRISDTLRAFAVSLDGPGLLLVALADSSFLSIPEGNDLLIVILSTGKTWERMAYYVIMTIVGSLGGCLLLYLVGRKGGSPFFRRKFSERNVARAERLFERYGIWAVVIPCLLPPPCPFKVFVLGAGVFRLGMLEFLVAVALGRTIRYSFWGILAVLYGNSVRLYMQQNLPKVGMVLSALFLLVTIILIAAYARRQRRLRVQPRA